VLIFAALAILPALATTAAPASGARVVPRSEILAAMRGRQGYDLTATTNGARFQAEVLLDLLRTSPAPDGPFLYVDHEDWFASYLERIGLPAEKAPLFVRLAHEHGQDMEVDARPGRVIERVTEGPPPRTAANVRIGWRSSRGGKDGYSYDDTLAIPDLRVTNERIVVYRLVDYGDMICYDDVEGLRARPTEGFLGVLFDVIGEGSIQWSRMTISPDGLQVSHARAAKGPFRVESTLTVFPDGRVEKDLPAGRSDLAPLEKRLLEPRKVHYLPFDRQRAPGEAAR
jgi:hypothetical protein